MEKKKEIITGFIFLSVSAIVYISSFSIRKLVVARIGSAFIPQLMSIVLAILSIILILQALASKDLPAKKESKPRLRRRKHSVALTFVLILLYLTLMEPVGFLVSSAVYLFLQFLVLSRKSINFLLYGILSIGTSIIIYFLFVRGFSLFLPAGILG